ncbi:MAG: tetratricopeptide repeat protein [Candidatus Obscuribacterales bacterium]|nr:tetratricopeptide repeat protein [Candidatus Obscuribacterales bacterium]
MSQFNFVKAKATLTTANAGGSLYVNVLPDLLEAGAAYHACGYYAEAEQCYKHVAVVKKGSGVIDEALMTNFHRLGVLYRLQDKFNQSETAYTEAINVAKLLFGPSHTKVVDQKAYLAGLYHHYGREEDALRIAQEALEVYEASQGQESPTVAICHFALAFIYMKMGERGEAKAHADAAAHIFAMQVYGREETIAGVLMGMAVFHFRKNEIESAEDLFKSACLLSEERLWQFHPIVPETLFKLGAFYESQRSQDKAELCYEAALRRLIGAFGEDSPLLREPLKRVASYHASRGNTDKVIAYEEQLVKIGESFFDPF